MRLPLLPLLLLSSAAFSVPAAADPPAEQEASQSEAPPPAPPPPAPPPPRERENGPRRMIERADRELRSAEAPPERGPVERGWRRDRDTDFTPPAQRQVRPEPQPAQAAENEASGTSVDGQPKRGWGRPTDARRLRMGGAPAGWDRRDDGAEPRNRNREVPPTAGSPVFGSAVPTPGTVTRPPRKIAPGSVTDRRLRDRIAAEGLRRDRASNDGWRRDWRQDRRYDWRRHRDRDRNRFHLGIYIDPFGWQYRNYDIGWRLPSRYFASRYWINDPWNYRLPPVGGYLRWVRYHDDVLLVDLRSGRVLDRIRDFFW